MNEWMKCIQWLPTVYCGVQLLIIGVLSAPMASQAEEKASKTYSTTKTILHSWIALCYSTSIADFIFQRDCHKQKAQRSVTQRHVHNEKLWVIKSIFFPENLQPAWKLLTLVDWCEIKCSGCAVKQVNSVSCCTVRRYRRLSEWFWGCCFFSSFDPDHLTSVPGSNNIRSDYLSLIWWVLSKNCN